MALKKVTRGQTFRPQADDWNAFVDAAQAHRDRQGQLDGGAPGGALPAGEIMVYVSAWAEYERYSLLTPAHNGYNLLIDPGNETFDEDAFLNRRPILQGRFGGNSLTGGTPGSFLVVLQEPVRVGQTAARARYAGLTPCRVEVRNLAHHYAEIIPGAQTKLRSCAGGGIRIVAGPAATGTSWCMVHLGDCGPTAAMARIDYDSGQAIELPYTTAADPPDTYHWLAYSATILPGMAGAQHFNADAAMMPPYTATVLVPGQKALYGTRNDIITGVPLVSTMLPVQWSPVLGYWVGTWTSPVTITGHSKVTVQAYQVGVGPAGLSPHYIGSSEGKTIYIAMGPALHWPPINSGPRLVTDTTGYSWFLPVGTYATDADGNCTSLVSYFPSPPVLPFNAGFTGSRRVRELATNGYEQTVDYVYANGILTGVIE